MAYWDPVRGKIIEDFIKSTTAIDFMRYCLFWMFYGIMLMIENLLGKIYIEGTLKTKSRNIALKYFNYTIVIWFQFILTLSSSYTCSNSMCFLQYVKALPPHMWCKCRLMNTFHLKMSLVKVVAKPPICIWWKSW